MYKFEFDENEVNLILAGLGELKASSSYNLINKMYATISAVKSEQKNDKEKK